MDVQIPQGYTTRGEGEAILTVYIRINVFLLRLPRHPQQQSNIEQNE